MALAIFTRIKLFACVLACAHEIARIKWTRLLLQLVCGIQSIAQFYFTSVHLDFLESGG